MPSKLTPRPWSVTTGGYLLAAQSAALLGTGLALLQVAADWAPVLADPELLAGPLVIGLACLCLGVVAFANALQFLRRQNGSWLVAMLLQGLSLGLALLLYWRDQHLFSYLLMVFGILMTVYLNRGDVLTPFHVTVTPLGGPHRRGEFSD